MNILMGDYYYLICRNDHIDLMNAKNIMILIFEMYNNVSNKVEIITEEKSHSFIIL